MKKTFFLFIVSAISFSSCKKDSVANSNCTPSDASIPGNYKLTAVKYKASAAATEADWFNDPSYYAPCDKDDIYTLSSNHTAQITDAGIVCSPSNSYSTTWYYSNSTFTFDGDSYNVDAYTCNSFTISYNSGYLIAGDKLTMTFIRQ